MSEAGVKEIVESKEFSCFARLYGDALRRMEKQRNAERQRLGNMVEDRPYLVGERQPLIGAHFGGPGDAGRRHATNTTPFAATWNAGAWDSDDTDRHERHGADDASTHPRRHSPHVTFQGDNEGSMPEVQFRSSSHQGGEQLLRKVAVSLPRLSPVTMELHVDQGQDEPLNGASHDGRIRQNSKSVSPSPIVGAMQGGSLVGGGGGVGGRLRSGSKGSGGQPAPCLGEPSASTAAAARTASPLPMMHVKSAPNEMTIQHFVNRHRCALQRAPVVAAVAAGLRRTPAHQLRIGDAASYPARGEKLATTVRLNLGLGMDMKATAASSPFF